MRSVTEAYRTQLTQLEATVLASPSADTVRHLHILSADLLMLRRGLTPLQNVVYALRRYDTERAMATRPNTAATLTGVPSVATPTVEKLNPFAHSTGLLPGSATGSSGGMQQAGFLSQQAKVSKLCLWLAVAEVSC